MKFSNAVVLATATGAYAQISVIQGVLSSVGTAIDSLDSAAKSFNGDVSSVKSKGDALIAAIKDGKTKVDGSSDLALTDALGLTDPVQALTKKGQTLADDFKSQRSEVEKAGACDTVRSSLNDINSNSQALIKSVVGKVPKDAQTIAEQLASGLTKVLDQAGADFSEANCKNSGNAAASTQASAPASKTGAASTQASAPASKAASSAAQGSVPATKTAQVPATTLAPITTASAPAGRNSTTVVRPPVTAGAAVMAPAGALVMAVAAALL